MVRMDDGDMVGNKVYRCSQHWVIGLEAVGALFPQKPVSLHGCDVTSYPVPRFCDQHISHYGSMPAMIIVSQKSLH